MLHHFPNVLDLIRPSPLTLRTISLGFWTPLHTLRNCWTLRRGPWTLTSWLLHVLDVSLHLLSMDSFYCRTRTCLCLTLLNILFSLVAFLHVSWNDNCLHPFLSLDSALFFLVFHPDTAPYLDKSTITTCLLLWTIPIHSTLYL
jgi:hypothetical protein